MKTLWRFELKGARSVMQKAPLISGELAIATMSHGQGANFQGTIAALDITSGEEKWRFERPHYFAPPVLGDDGAIYVAGFDGFAHKISPEGEALWSTQLRPQNMWSGLQHDGRFIVSEIAGQSRYTWALDADTGDIAWQYEDGGHCYGFAGDREGSVFIPISGGKFPRQIYALHKIDIATGQKKWRTESKDILFRPVIFQDLIITGSNGCIFAFDRKTSSLVSSIRFADHAKFFSPGVVDGDRIILASEHGQFVAMGLQSKKGFFGKAKLRLAVAWEAELGSKVEAFSMGKGQLVALLGSGALVMIDPADGAINASHKLGQYAEGFGISDLGDGTFIAARGRTFSRIQP